MSTKASPPRPTLQCLLLLMDGSFWLATEPHAPSLRPLSAFSCPPRIRSSPVRLGPWKNSPRGTTDLRSILRKRQALVSHDDGRLRKRDTLAHRPCHQRASLERYVSGTHEVVREPLGASARKACENIWAEKVSPIAGMVCRPTIAMGSFVPTVSRNRRLSIIR
jgi:hypothetical protein